MPDARYDKVMEAFGGLGFFVETREQLKEALKVCVNSQKPSLINVKISPHASKKPQVNNMFSRFNILFNSFHTVQVHLEGRGQGNPLLGEYTGVDLYAV